jgi:D-alanyl-D-alanine carboxypeptidase/D-alanyl-D-alanine-endopeptidase (penicillin-binding protein 4)
MKSWALFLLAATAAAGASLPESIERLLAASPVSRTAFWGIQVVELSSGKTIYELNPEHLFIPASNTKLFTTALALSRLGPDHTYTTRVLADAAPDPDGRIAGTLRLIGGGDPNLSARPLPYRIGPVTGDPLAPIDDLARQVIERGVKRVAGDIVGDDTWYVWQPYAVGWGLDDPQSDDGPPISALTVNDNVVSIGVLPGPHEGDLGIVTLSPPVEFYRIENRTRTVPANADNPGIHIERIPGSRDVRLWGTIPMRRRAPVFLMSIEDPAEYAAMALRRALEDRGVTVEGSAIALHRRPDEVEDLKEASAAGPASGVELARRVSAPLIEDLRVTDKVSQNLHAELTLRAVARARRNVGSFEAAEEEMKAFLGELGIAPEAYDFRDGSGLSRLNLVTPSAVVRLLRFMYGGPRREDWISLLPVGGRDGTLSNRFLETPAAGRIYAKTGSLSHVSALSGYLKRSDGTWAAFSILVNNYNARAQEARAIMDRICNLIIE